MGAGDRERWLLETLVGMRGMVALGSRTPRRIQDLRGNDEGVAGTTRGRRGGSGGTEWERATAERWLLETLVGMRGMVALGSRLRGAGTTRGSRERRGGVETAGAGDRERWLLETLVGMRGRRGGLAGTTRGRRGAARERRGGRGNDEGATRGQQGNDEGATSWETLVGMRGMVALGSRGGTTNGRGNGGSGRPGEVAVEDLGWYEGWLRWVPAFAGTTRGSRERRGGDEGAAGERRMGAGDRERWLLEASRRRSGLNSRRSMKG